MQTGIRFFDAQDPKPGDLWVVAGRPCDGRTTLTRNLTAWLARDLVAADPSARTLCWDVEVPRAHYIAKMTDLVEDPRPLNLDYTNERWPAPHGLAEFIKGRRIVAIDQLDLVPGVRNMSPRDHNVEVDGALRELKYTAVRCECLVIAALSLPFNDADDNGDLHPFAKAKGWLDYADVMLMPRSKGDGRMTVHVLKGANGLVPSAPGIFELHRDGPLVPVL